MYNDSIHGHEWHGAAFGKILRYVRRFLDEFAIALGFVFAQQDESKVLETIHSHSAFA